MKSTTAMYIGSFDPFTLGHLDVINKAFAKTTSTIVLNAGVKANFFGYNKLIVCVGDNEDKTTREDANMRKYLIELALKDHPHAKDITVIAESGLTVDIAYRHGVTTLIRGIRSNSADWHSEKQLAETNRFLAATRGFALETIFIEQTDPFLQMVSSSLVRKLCDMEEYVAMARLLPQCIAEEIITPMLYAKFASLTKGATVIRDNRLSKTSVAYWEEIKTAYVGRPYHNLIHLTYLFKILDIYKLHCKDKKDYIAPSKNLTLAIFMHDFVCDASPKEHPLNNEHSSANTALFWCRKGVFERDISGVTVHRLIMATVPEPKDDLTDEQKLMADLDFSILGTADTATYNAYADGIRKEYYLYSDEDYKTGRLAFLFALLKRKHIFHLDFFRQMFEDQARQNITAEIKRLHGKA